MWYILLLGWLYTTDPTLYVWTWKIHQIRGYFFKFFFPPERLTFECRMPRNKKSRKKQHQWRFVLLHLKIWGSFLENEQNNKKTKIIHLVSCNCFPPGGQHVISLGIHLVAMKAPRSLDASGVTQILEIFGQITWNCELFWSSKRYIHVYIYIYVYIYVHIYIHIYIYICDIYK